MSIPVFSYVFAVKGLKIRSLNETDLVLNGSAAREQEGIETTRTPLFKKCFGLFFENVSRIVFKTIEPVYNLIT